MAVNKTSSTTVVFSNADQASSETDYTTDGSLNTVQFLDVLAQSGGAPNTILWSIGTSQIGADGWTAHGSIGIPTELLAQDTAYSIDNGAYESTLGANIFLTGATGLVGYDMSGMSAATKAFIDNLSVGQTISDSFDYAIRNANGTISWNTVNVVISGAAANIDVTGGSVQEGVSVDQNGNLHDIESISVRAASGDATSFAVTPASAETLGDVAVNDDGTFMYTVSDAAILATHMGYGESQQEWFTITTANGTALNFYETVYGNIHAPVVTASAAQAAIQQGQSVGLNISAQDIDDNAHLSYVITGVPMGAMLGSAADPGGVLYDSSSQSWSVAAGAVADLKLTTDLDVSGQIHLTVTVTNTETSPNEVAVASASAGIDVAVTGNSVVLSGTTVVGGNFDGATQLVEAGATAIGASVGGGGSQEVFGTASGTVVTFAGVQIVESGALAAGATILDGGLQDVFGNASGTLVSGRGYEVVESSGMAQGTTVANGATQYVSGSANDAVINAFGTQIVESGGTAIATSVSSSGEEIVSSGGITSSTILNSGGFEAVSSGGVGDGTIVGSGGFELVLSGGMATGTTVQSGGTESVGGSESQAAVLRGGQLLVSSGGLTSAAAISGGGVELVTSGGVANTTIIDSGGAELILSGGSAMNALISGGLLDVEAGGSVGSIAFVGSGGSYEVDGSNIPTNPVFGFAPGDTIDLRAVLGGAADNVSLGANNLLTIIDQNGHSYSLQLDPAQSFFGQTFNPASDNFGGTSLHLSPFPHV